MPTESPLIQLKLLVKKSPIHGYGVFADQDIQAGDIIEECYSLVIDKYNSTINNYTFKSKKRSILPLGFGCLYNHSDDPNAKVNIYLNHPLTEIRAKRPIKQGQEIFISYGKEWFSSRKAKHKEPSLRLKARNFFSFMRFLARLAIVVSVLFGVVGLMQWMHP